MNEPKENTIAHWIMRFMLDYLATVRNCSPQTRKSYRDAYRKLLPYVAKKCGRSVDVLRVADVSRDRVLSFLDHLERDCGNSARTRNQRLAAIMSLAKYISTQSPEHVEWFGSLRSIPSKKTTNRLITYLEREEMDAIMSAPDSSTERGFRDRVMLRFLYNTGARADEVAKMKVRDVHFSANKGETGVVDIMGKGRKQRRCPLMKTTEDELRAMIGSRTADSPLFVGRQGHPMTRYGIHRLVAKYAKAAARNIPAIADKRPSPHTIRRTTATHLVEAGVDVNTVRAWMGHASIETTNVYVEISMDAKVKAMEAGLSIKGRRRSRRWRDDKKLMAFLDGIR